MSTNLKIGDLARRTGCAAETIRYYEREGLIPEPTRTAGNYRVYGRGHIERVAFIRNCRSLDMTLEEIRRLLLVLDLPREGCRAAHRLLDEHIAHVAARLAELQLLEKQLKSLRRQCGPARGKERVPSWTIWADGRQCSPIGAVHTCAVRIAAEPGRDAG